MRRARQPETASRARRADRPARSITPAISSRPTLQAPGADARSRPRRCATSTHELAQLAERCRAPRTIQNIVFEVGKRHPFESLRDWFQALYETLLGSSQGPRMGSFIALYGIDNSRRLIAEALA